MLSNADEADKILQLDKFTSETDEWIDTILNSLGWSQDKIFQVNPAT